jgi:basic amino acid/polyamine antiporter, APA family
LLIMNKEKSELIKGLGLIEASTIVIGSMIGSGIFIAPSLMAGLVQSPGLIVLLWLVGGIFTICGALSYGELCASMPKAGGQYVFLREAYSPFWAFLYGWTVFLVIQTGFISAVAVAFSKYLGVFFPWISENHLILTLGLFQLNSAQIIAILSIFLLTGINIIGLKSGAFVQNLFTLLKVIAVATLIICAFTIGHGNWANFTFAPIVPQAVKMGLWAAMAVALSKALFAYDAWNSVTFTAEEVKDPHSNLPRSLLLGALGVTLIYVLTTAAYFYILPGAQAAQVPDNRIAAAVAHAIFGNPGLWFISIAILISTFGCNNGLILSGARVYYAMAKDKLFLKSAGEVHPKFKVPVNALIYQCLWSSILVLSGKYSDLLTYTAFASVLFNTMTVAGLFVLRRKMPDLHRPHKTWGFPVIPIIYILISLWFLIFIVQGDLRNTGLGFLVILTGLPAYWYLKKKHSL